MGKFVTQVHLIGSSLQEGSEKWKQGKSVRVKASVNFSDKAKPSCGAYFAYNVGILLCCVHCMVQQICHSS